MRRVCAVRYKSNIPTPDEIIKAARNLVQVLRDRAQETEDLRDLPEQTVRDLKAAGIHKIFTPRRYGGFEMDWGVHVDVSRELGRGCGSTSWVSSVVFCHTWLLARFPPECQEEFWPDHPDAVIGTAFAGGGTMTEVDGGFIIKGRWKFSSGIRHSDCAIVAAQIDDGVDEPHSGRTAVFRMAMLLPSEYEIVDTWDSEGLRGTGSHDIQVDEKFIPRHRTILTEDAIGTSPPGAKLHDSYIYKVEFSPYFFTLVAGPMLGTALGGLEEYCRITKERVGQMFKETVAEQIPVQMRIGESAAEIQAANLLIENITRYLHERGSSGENLSGDALQTIRRDMALASRMCLEAVSRVSGMMGVTGQARSNPVQRYFRDCRTISTHGGLQWDASMAPVGKRMLGLKTGDARIDNSQSDPRFDRVILDR